MNTPASASAPLVRAEGLGYGWPGLVLLQDLSFSIHPGLSLVRGGEGRGKTTLLRLMAGTAKPGSGLLLRHDGASFHETPADPAHDATRVRTWLDERQAAHAAAWDDALAAALIDAFGLGEHLDKTMHMLSTGSRRKAGLVAAAASGAPLTLIDMPFAALDAASCRVLAELLADAAEDTQRAWVIADHEAPAPLAGVRWSTLIDLGD